MVESLLDLSELLAQSTWAESGRAKRWDRELKSVIIKLVGFCSKVAKLSNTPLNERKQ